MSTGLVQRSTSDENTAIKAVNNKPKPLQASTNIIHTKIPKRIDNIVHDKARLDLVKQTSDSIKDKSSCKQRILKPSEKKVNKTPKVNENDGAQNQFSIHKKTTTTTPVKKTDENDVESMLKSAYDPLRDVYPFDEELYQKVLKLELADDGLPKFESDEPFDF